MADATISTKIKLDGEAEYKQRISEINAALGTLDSKIKLLNTTYAGNENSIKGLTEINEVLNQKILTQRDKVEQLQEMLQKSAKAYGISDTTTQKYQQQLNNAEAALVKMERALADNTSKLEAAGGAADNFSDGLADLAERTNKLGESLRGDKEQKYKQSIDQLNASIDVLDAQMRKVAAEYEDSADSADLMAKKNDILTQKIIQQANKVDLLESAFKNAAEYYEIGAVETSRWEKELANAEAELYKMENQLKRNTEQMAKANEETGESAQSMGEIGDAAEEAGKGTGNLGDVVNGLTSKLGIQLPDSMKTSMNGMLQLDTTTVAVAGGFAAVAAAIVKAEKALISMTKEAASNADDLLTLASVTGTTTDSVQELNYMADLTDVSFDRIKDSLKETTNKMQEAATGTGDAYEAYKRLKVEITNTDGSLRSAQDVFYDTIDALGEMKNKTERDALAMDLMSESAQELNPLIELGSEKMQEYAQEAHDMGYVLDNDALKALQGVDDAYSRLQKTQEGVKNQLAVEFAPYLEEFYGDVTSGIKYIGDVLQQSGLVDAFGMLLETAGDIIAPMDTLSNDKVPALTRALRPLAELMAAIADAGDFVSGLLSLDFNKVGTALGLNYSKGQMSNVQRLNTKWMQQDTNRATAANGYGSYFDTDTGKAYGNMESYANAQYESLVRAGDSSVLGKSQDLWVQEYLKKLRGNAAGTDNWSGGWTRVNENGLERIFLPSGSRIQTASETRYTSGDTYKTTVYVDHVEDLDTILRIAKNARITARMGAK
nr:MAG TPA: tail tape measure [Caudoviricetes sp.]